jgi:5'-nucleotidase
VDRKTRDVTAMTARIVTTWADEGPGLTPNLKVAAMVDEARAKVAPLINRIVGTAATDILKAQNPAGESALGNLIADAQREAMGTDFAFMNPGGVRADLNAGEITWGELFTIQPFGNDVVIMTLTGAQIKTLLEQQWLNQPFARILQPSGLTYTWDNALPVSGRVVEIRKDGIPLDPAAPYTVAVNSFMAAGGDNFTVLRAGTDRVVGPVDLDALVDYVEGRTPPLTETIEGRITRLN